MESRNGLSRHSWDASQEADPSASFDPARTGDPTPAAPGRADLGVGYAGRDGAFELPSRNPIGFAPPADPARDVGHEPRFRTEISFKRHHTPVSPLASSRFDSPGDELEPEPGSADLVWPMPEEVAEHHGGIEETQAEVLASSSGDGEAATEPEAYDEPAAEEPQMFDEPVVPGTDEKVSFYKRELSFRRRKPEREAVAAPVVDEPVVEEAALEEPVAVEPSFEAPSFEEPVAEEPVVDEPAFEEPVEEELVVDEPAFEEPVAEEPVVDEPAFEGPVAEEPVADEPTLVEEPVAAAVMAGTESENGGRSFGRKRNGVPAPASARKSGRGRGKKVVGLKIGASQIAAAVVSERDGRHELVQLARRPIDSGLVVDGEIRDADALAHVLKAFFDEHKLPKKDVRIGLASNRIGVRTFDIAGIDDEVRFDNAVRFKAHEVLPVAQHESVLDYRVLEERPNQAGEPSRRILLVVAPRDQVEP
ncbi:MAG: pilus assembly protein PilM, partial [Gaiellaceae bacterium]